MTFYGKTKKGTQVSFDGRSSPEVIMTVQDKDFKILVNEAFDLEQAQDLRTALDFAIRDAVNKVT